MAIFNSYVSLPEGNGDGNDSNWAGNARSHQPAPSSQVYMPTRAGRTATAVNSSIGHCSSEAGNDWSLVSIEMGDFIVIYCSFIVINAISMEIYEFMGSLWESNMVWWCLMMFDGKRPPFHSMIFAFKAPFFWNFPASRVLQVWPQEWSCWLSMSHW